MTKKNRFIASVLALTIILLMLLSASFIAVESHHDCTGEECTICNQLAVCETVLKTMATVFAVAVIVSVMTEEIVVRLGSLRDDFGKKTLVTLKVKLTN